MEEEPLNVTLARDTRDSFDRYAVALTFTVLGLGITTGHFSHSLVANVAELLAWPALLASGLMGLWRLELIPRLYEERHRQAGRTERQATVVALSNMSSSLVRETGLVNLEPIERANKEVDRGANNISRAEASLVTRYRVQRWLFVIGVLLLLTARAYVPIRHLIDQVRDRIANAN